MTAISKLQSSAKRYTMHRIRRQQKHLRMLVPAVLLILSSSPAKCQDGAATPPVMDVAAELKSLVASVNQLQSQMQTLNSQMTELRASQQQAVLEAEQLRVELNRTREQLGAKTAGTNQAPEPAAQTWSSSSVSAAPSSQPSPDVSW